MRALKIICALFCLLSVASAITGIQAVHWSSSAGVTSTRLSSYGTIWSFVEALLFAGAFYGIHIRAPIVWKLGWGVLGILFLEFSIGAVSSSLKLPQPDKWIVSTAVLVGGAGVTVYWGLWWKRQKSYFFRAAGTLKS